MRIVHDLLNADLDVPEPLVVTVGAFDGVHLGHQQVIRQVVSWAHDSTRPATAGLLTFEPLPREVLNHRAAPGRLTTSEQKLALIEQLDIDIAFILRFDRALATMSPEQFVRVVLVEKLKIAGIVLGHDYRFGANGAGNYDNMLAL